LSTKEIARAFLINKPTRWPNNLTIDDALLTIRDDALARLNRAVALAEAKRREAALVEVDAPDLPGLASFLPSNAVRAGCFPGLACPTPHGLHMMPRGGSGRARQSGAAWRCGGRRISSN